MIGKEVRALLPAWTLCAVGLLASANGGIPLRGLAPLLYVVGAAALGALAIGHEFSHRTMGLLLSQPVSRYRVLLTKVGVLAVLLGALVAVAWAALPLPQRHPVFGTVFLWTPACAALFITPWLTLASRSPVGGAVFTLSLGGIVLVVAEWIGVRRFGYTAEVDLFRLTALWWSTLALSAVGAVMTWTIFSRLQIEDGGTEVRLTPAAATARQTFTRRRAGWLLVAKELHVQQLALAVGGVYALTYAVAALTQASPWRSDDALTILMVLYGGLVAMLTGSMASAEERNWRTLDAQLLLPVRAAWQWLIKVGVTMGLALTLAVALPALLIWILPPHDPLTAARAARRLFAISTFLTLASLTALSFYVSTLSSSGFWALLLSLPAAVAVATCVMWLGDVLARSLFRAGGRPNGVAMEWAGAVLAIAVIALVLRLALANHRSASHDPGRTAVQVGAVAAAITASIALVGVAGILAR